MVEAWERRQQGAHKHSGGLPSATYPQLEFLQEQAELVNINQQGYVMPGQYTNMHVPSGPGGGHHRASQSFSGTQSYQMQPPINHQDYRGQRSGIPPLSLPANLQPTSDYDPPSSSSRSYLPAFPPPVATSNPSSATFDAFDNRDSNMGLLYTPLQPTQAAAANYPYSPGHAARQSYSGPYGQTPQRNNPFAPNQPSPNSPRRYGGYGAA
jgi:dual specificity protein kinase YAK1